MSFKELDNIKLEYVTVADDAIENFYIPTLKKARFFKRAVGYFSSALLLQLTKGLCQFARNGGKMQLLVSPRLSKEDYDAIEKGYSIHKIAEERIINNFNELEEFEQKNDRFGLLAYMISNNLLEVKVVLLNENNDKALYHEKLGIMKDECDNSIVFTGSANDTFNAFNLNYEAIDVFCSWKSDDLSDRCNVKEYRFDRLWRGTENGAMTFDFPEIIKNKILKYNPSNLEDVFSVDEQYINNLMIRRLNDKPKPNIKMLNKLYDYQQLAIKNWKYSNYKGIFDMATGTGKTFTGTGAILQLLEDKKRAFVVICCPYIHLVDQWEREMKIFNIDSIKCYGGLDYKKTVERATNKFKHKRVDFVCLICVNRTFSNAFIQSVIDTVLKDTMILVDEAHNFGSFKLSECLKKGFPYRLALSATLDRYGDEKGTKKLYDFFGEKCITYSLEKAIEENKLTEYKYYPVVVSLNDDELEKYIELTKKIGKYADKGFDSDRCKKLLIERARLIAGAKNKLIMLSEKIKPYKKAKNMLVYVGAVKYGEDDYDNDLEGKKQIETVMKMLTVDIGMTFSKFTSEENTNQRNDILTAFKEEFIQGLVAIKCLDEGMNIPSIKTAFILASSTNPKEYIQRRGRVLRKAPNKDYAEIYDFITLPYSLDDVSNINTNLTNQTLGLVKRELTRAMDFINLSKNMTEGMNIIEQIKERYNMEIIGEANIYE